MKVLVALAIAAAVGAQNTPTVYKPGNGVTLPIPIREVRPQYTQAARDAHIQGRVLLDVVVLADGEVGDVNIAQSLDTTYGLDEQALTAMKQWEFRPGKKDGTPVAVQIQVEMTFKLK